jgi:hypothetical protein
MMTRDGFDFRPVYGADGVLAGYAWTKRGYAAWGATRKEYPADPTPGRGIGFGYPDLASAAAAVVANVRTGRRQ